MNALATIVTIALVILLEIVHITGSPAQLLAAWLFALLIILSLSAIACIIDRFNR